MKETLYIMSSNVKISKNKGTLECVSFNGDNKNKKHKQNIPIERLKSAEAYGNITISTPLLRICNELKIPLYLNSYYGVPIGKFIPATPKSSIVKLMQYESFKKKERKLHIAQAIITKAGHNRLKIIKKYDKENNCNKQCKKIKEWINKITNKDKVNELRGVEGNMMKFYLRAFRKMLYNLPFGKRSTQPPKDEGNAILSFGNVVLYNKVDAIIYRTSLDSQVGFLHEPHENRASLSLDISEIFRPLLVDNLILRLDHKGNLLPQHFISDEFKCYLNERGKKIWLREWKKYLRSSFLYKPLKRHISVEEAIKIECYNLIKYLSKETNKYKPIYFQMR
jgi:CRISPR-associated protein Cas1